MSMADGRLEAPATGIRTQRLWTEIFQSFQVALDPRKLIIAAVGILITAFGWWLLSIIFYGSVTEPMANADAYSTTTMTAKLGPKKSDNTTDYKPEEYAAEGQKNFQRDYEQWFNLHRLAGPGGRLRTMPWNEYRGENPFLFITKLSDSPSSVWGERIKDYVLGQIFFLTEPLVKLLVPIIKMIDPNASFLTRIYLLLCLLWSVAVWAFFGGVITRIAAVQFGGKERISMKQAFQFVSRRYVSYMLSPIVPLGIIAVIVLCMSVYGLIALIPILGDIVLYGLGLPLVILGGIVMAILLIGLVSYPLMYTTISVEGSDTFDALSRSYNYVFQRPWHYLWYALVSILYGAAVTFVVVVVGCLMVYLGKWAVSQPASAFANDRKPDFLFVYSPESYGWKELLLKGSPIEKKEGQVEIPNTKLMRTGYVDVNKQSADEYMKGMTWWNYAGAGMVTFWMVIIFLLMIGFSYSYFWSASTMIYLLMRKTVDDVPIDDVFVELEPATPTIQPPQSPVAPAPAPTPGGGFSLPTVPPSVPPVVPPSVPPAVPPVVPPSVPPAVPPVVPPSVPPAVPPVEPPSPPPFPA